MGTNTSIAIDTLDRLAVQHQGIIEAAKQLRELGSYQDAITQLKTEHAQVTQQLAATSEVHGQAQADLAIAQTEAEATRRQATADAAAIRDGARADVDAMLTEAKVKVSAELDRQLADRADARTALEQEIRTASQRLAEINAQIHTSAKYATEAEARAQAAQENLTRIRAAASKMAVGT